MRYRIAFLLLFMCGVASAQLAIPDHGGYWVHDEAGLLSSSAKAELESILKRDRDSTSNQIAVLIIPSLEGEIPEEFSLKVAEKWGLGNKEKDNGVLLLIAIKDRFLRIETGSGLEGVLTDMMSSRINRNEIAPHFRKGDYDGGIKAGVLAIIQVIKGEYTNDEPVTKERSSRRLPFGTIIIIIIIIIIISRRGGRGGGGYWSSGSGWIGPMGGFGGGGGSGWGSSGGGDFGGGGGFSGGGSSDSW